MNTKATVRLLVAFLLPLSVFSQGTYFMPGTKEKALVERLEIKNTFSSDFIVSQKPFNREYLIKAIQSRQNVIAALQNVDSAQVATSAAFNLSAIDQYNIERLFMNNPEWAIEKESYKSKKPILKYFFKTPGIMYSVKTDHFFLAINPMISYHQVFEKDNDQNLFYNSRGLNIRGIIDNKIGFELYVTDNQERDPLYVQQYVTKNAALPGVGLYKPFKEAGGADYFDVKASVIWKAGKHVNMQLGYDKNFVGDGYRSLFLSDFSTNSMFLKYNVRFGKFNYEHILMELIPNLPNVLGGFLSRNYYKMNHLNFEPNKALRVGLFYATMYGSGDKFNVLYLLPVINLHPENNKTSSPDNSYIGADARVNIKRTVQVYGQLLVDKLKLSEKNHYWGNRFGHQLGIKYIDVLGVKNLDLQVEENRVRPFTYSAAAKVGTYVHYYQPLAHPLGANFQEYVAILRYQPLNKLHLQARAIYFTQGLDSAGKNFGSNLFVSNTTRSGDYNYEVGSGNKVKCLNASFLASYEIFENLFIDGNVQIRNYKREIGATDKTTVISLGVRWNMLRREFDF